MRIDTTNLTPEAHQAIVECLKIAARRGRQLREAREREQNTSSATLLNDNPSNEAAQSIPESSQAQDAKGS